MCTWWSFKLFILQVRKRTLPRSTGPLRPRLNMWQKGFLVAIAFPRQRGRQQFGRLLRKEQHVYGLHRHCPPLELRDLGMSSCGPSSLSFAISFEGLPSEALKAKPDFYSGGIPCERIVFYLSARTFPTPADYRRHPKAAQRNV